MLAAYYGEQKMTSSVNCRPYDFTIEKLYLYLVYVCADPAPINYNTLARKASNVRHRDLRVLVQARDITMAHVVGKDIDDAGVLAH